MNWTVVFIGVFIFGWAFAEIMLKKYIETIDKVKK